MECTNVKNKTERVVPGFVTDGKIHTDIMRVFKKLGVHAKATEKALIEATRSLFAYSPEQFPFWTMEYRARLCDSLEKAHDLLRILMKYDWSGKGYPALSKEDVALIRYDWGGFWFEAYSARSAFNDHMCDAFHMQAIYRCAPAGDYVDADTVNDLLKLRDLIAIIPWTVREVEEAAEQDADRRTTQRHIAYNYRSETGETLFHDGDMLHVSYCQPSEAKNRIGKYFIIEWAEDNDRLRLTKHCVFGRLVAYYGVPGEGTFLKYDSGSGSIMKVNVSRITCMHMVTGKVTK